MQLADILSKIVSKNVTSSIIYGVVTAIDRSGVNHYVSVTISGTDNAITGVRYSASYVPYVGDTVAIQVVSHDIFVLFSLAGKNNTSISPTAVLDSNQAIATATSTAVAFTAANGNTQTNWVVGSASRLTVVTAGRYAITGTGNFESNATGLRTLKIRKNGSADLAENTVVVRNVNAATDGAVVSTFGSHAHGIGATVYGVKMTVTSPVVDLVANDYVEMYVYQDSGISLNLVGSDPKPSLSLVYLGI